MPRQNYANDVHAEHGSKGTSTMFAEGSPGVELKKMLQGDEVELVLRGSVKSPHRLSLSESRIPRKILKVARILNNQQEGSRIYWSNLDDTGSF